MQILAIQSRSRNEWIDITSLVQKQVTEAAVQSGIAVIFTPHTTAAVTINENADPDVQHDVQLKLGRMIPKNEPGFRHMEGNSDSHLKSSLVSPSLSVIIEHGRIVLGTWQGIYFCEFDGPRHRKVFVKILAE